MSWRAALTASLLAFSCAVASTLAGEPLKDGYVPTQVVRSAIQNSPHAEDLPQLAPGQWMGNVYVLRYQYGGPYDESVNGSYNVEPRQWVARSFYMNNLDAYDFILVFTDFDFNSGEWLAFYNSINNHVLGIGLQDLDNSSDFGSQRLQGYIDAKRLSQYLTAGGSLDNDKLLQTLNHEIGHRWLAFCKYKDTPSHDSSALLGLDAMHWSYLLDSDASYMYGSRWRDNGDGTFTATDILEKYSPLDLYLMGLAPADEVSPFSLLMSQTVSANQLPHLGDTIAAQKSTVSLDQIIASEGTRIPGYEDAPHEFKVAVVYLLAPSTPSVNQGDLDKLEAMRALWKTSFFQQTGGRGLVEPGNNSGPSGPGTAPNLTLALQWLSSHAQADGSWRDSEATSLRDTSAAVEALESYPEYAPLAAAGTLAAVAMTPGPTELLARQGELLSARQNPAAPAVLTQLAGLGSADKGWGAFPRYAGDVATTARALRAFASAGRTDFVQPLWTLLESWQTTDAGWGWRPGGPSALCPTLEVLLAAKEALPAWSDQASVTRALLWVSQGRLDGGVGEPHPDVPETALFLQAIQGLPAFAGQAAEAAAFLGRRQSADGSWEQSAYKTGMAVAALKSAALPDPYVLQSDVAVAPASPYEGETLTLHAVAHNGGADLSAGTGYTWQILDAGDGHTVNALTGTLPAIASGGSYGLEQTWPNPAPVGSYSLRLVLDPDAQSADANRSNNSASVPLTIRAHAAGVDLRLLAGAIAVSPASITQVPQAVTVSGSVDNLGTAAANNATIAVFDGAQGSAVLGTTAVSVPGLASAPFSLQLTLGQARSYALNIVADPDNALSDLDRSNNTAQRTVPLASVEDLEVAPGSFTVTAPPDNTVGQPFPLHATVKNVGTVSESGVQVGFTYSIGSPPVQHPIQLLSIPGTLAPDAAADVDFNWRPNEPGDPLTVSVVVDPSGLISHDANLANNRADAAVTVAPSGLPNLVASPSGISVTPPRPSQGQSCHVTATVTNVGTEITGSFNLSLWVGRPPNGTPIATTTVAGLASGGSAIIDKPDWAIEGQEDLLLYVVADGGSAVQEFNEADNEAFVVLDVLGLPDLAVTPGSVSVTPQFPHVGEAVRFDVTVANVGDQDAQNVPVVLKDAQGSVLDSLTIPTVASHSGASVTLHWSNPAAAGESHLSVVANPDQTIPEAPGDNNTANLVVAVQDSNAYVSDRYFSPNGDGVKDTVTFYFRQGSGNALVLDPDQKTVRSIPIPSGAISVVWDGKDDGGSVVEDGSYQLRVGSLVTWTVVDNDLTTISGDPSVRLLEVELPANPSDQYASNGLKSPYPGDYFLIAQRQVADQTALVIEKCNTEGSMDIGALPPEVCINCDDYFLGGSMDGRVFLVRLQTGFGLLTFPGPTVVPLPLSDGGLAGTLALSPDGEWVVDARMDGSVEVVGASDPSHLYAFDAGPFSSWRAAQIHFPLDSREAVIVYAVGDLDSPDASVYFRSLTLSGTPQAADVVSLNWPPPDGYFLSAADFRRRTLTVTSGGPIEGRVSSAYTNMNAIAEFALRDGALLAQGTVPFSDDDGRTLSTNGRVVGHGSSAGDGTSLDLFAWHRKQLFSHAPVRHDYADWSLLDTFIFLHPTGDSSTAVVIPAATLADNLLLDLRPHVLFGDAGIQLTVTVADRNLDHYVIEYSAQGSQTGYQAIGASRSEPLYNDVWGTWLPPGNGRYALRLTASDLAGNQRAITRSVTWQGDRDIANLAPQSRYIAPLHGRQLHWTYTVLRPCNLLFQILDADGNVVRLLPKAEPTAPLDSSCDWDGTGGSGQTVSDGDYSLEYLGATWPVTVDDTLPEVSLEIGDSREIDNGLPQNLLKNLYVNLVTAFACDANLDHYSYEMRPFGGSDGTWVELARGNSCLSGGDGQPVLMDPFSIDGLAGRELRLKAVDLAGNEAEVLRSHSQEEIYFAESEPACRTSQPPTCVYPDRPALEEISDEGGLLNENPPAVIAPVRLWPSYNTLLVQHSIWNLDRSALKLDYRTPGGDWQEGTLSALPNGESALCERVIPGQASGGLVPAYWEHPDLAQQNYEVRLRAVDQNGVTVTSPATLFVPQFALGLEYLNTQDQSGGHYRLTNLGSGSLSSFTIVDRWAGQPSVVPGFWTGLPRSLGPGQSCEITTGCDPYGKLCSAVNPPRFISAWAEAYDESSHKHVSTECTYHPSQVFPSVFQTNLTLGDCLAGPAAPSGMFLNPYDPCDPNRHTPGGLVPFQASLSSLSLLAPVTSYDLLLDNHVVFTIQNPPHSFTGQLDLSSVEEGLHILTESPHSAQGESGGGGCTRSYNVIVDRTPPQLTVLSPTDGQVICESAGRQDVQVQVSDNSNSPNPPVFLTIDGVYQKGPWIDPAQLTAGLHAIGVMTQDPAGWPACAALHITVVKDAAPPSDLQADPKLFSPINGLGKPAAAQITFNAPAGTSCDLIVRSQAGTAVLEESGTSPEDGHVRYAWSGTDPLGVRVPDGLYDLAATVHVCGSTAGLTAKKAVEVDATAPAISVSSPGSGETAGAALEVRGQVTDKNLDHYDVQVSPDDPPNDPSWVTVAAVAAPVAGPSGLLGSWDTGSFNSGPYLLRVRAEDKAGNESVTEDIPVSVRPKGLIQGFSAAPTLFSPAKGALQIHYALVQDALVTLSILDSGGDVVKTISNCVPAGDLQYACTWNGRGSSEQEIPDGAYTVRLHAEDAAQPPVLQAEGESLTVILDQHAPTLEITNIAESGLYGLPLDVNASLADANPGPFTIKLSGPGGTTLTMKEGSGALADEYVATLQNLPDGAYQILFDASDAAGNASDQLVRSFTLDSSRPAVQITSPARGAFVKDALLTLQGTIGAAHLQSYEWQYKGAEGDFISIYAGTTVPDGGNIEYPWDISASDVSDGPYTLRLLVQDQLGHQQEDRLTFTVDRTPPEAGIDAPSQGQLLSGPVDVTGFVRDANVSQWTLDVIPSGGSPYQPPLGSGLSSVENGLLAHWLLLPPDGAYALRLTALDKAGNATRASVDVQVGATEIAPPVNLTAAVQSLVNVQLSWQAGAGETPAGYNVYRDAQRITSSPVTAASYLDANVAQGAHTYTVRALGAQGRESADSNAVTVAISLGAPVVMISSPPQGAAVSGTVPVSGTAYCDVDFKDFTVSVRPSPSGDWTPVAHGAAPVVAGLLGTWNSLANATPEGTYEIKLDAEDTHGHAAIVSVTVTLDNTAPATAPILETAEPTPADSNNVHTSWRYPSAPPDLAGYYLYRDGALANAPGPVIGPRTPYRLTGTAYDDAGVVDGTHVYTVTGVDRADNESAASNAISVRLDLHRPHAVISSPADNAQIQGATTVIAQCPDTDVVSVQFEFQADSDSTWSAIGDPLSHRPYQVLFTPPQHGVYRLHAVASDAGGSDPAPAFVTVTVTDLPPSPPVSLVARVDGGNVILTWPASADPFNDLAGYRIYRDGALLTATALPKGVLTYEDANLADRSDDYVYTVRSVDLAGQEGPESPPAPAHVYAPQFGFANPIQVNTAVDLQGLDFWAPGTGELQKRNVAGEFETVRSLSTTHSALFSQVELTPGFNTFRLLATDGLGNRSKPSSPLVLVRHDVPAAPENVSASVAGSDVTLTWTASPDLDSTGFRVLRDGDIINESESPLNDTSDPRALSASGGTYEDMKRAADGDPDTGWAPAAVPDEYAPAYWQWIWPVEQYVSKVNILWQPGLVPYGFDVDFQAQGEWLWWATYSGNTQQEMAVDAGLTASGIRIRLRYYAPCDFLPCPPQLNEVRPFVLSRTQGTTFTDDGLAQGVYAYGVRQAERWGQLSGTASANAFVGVAPPAAPAGLIVSATSNCDELALTWTAPDPPQDGLQGYRIYRANGPGGSLIAVATVDGETMAFQDSGLQPGVQYDYAVTALVAMQGTLIETPPTSRSSGTPACVDPSGPVITYPTTAGNPIAWPTAQASIGGSAVPGSEVHLLQDGADVATTTAQRMAGISLPGFAGQAVALSGDGSEVAFLAAEPDTGRTRAAVLDVRTGVLHTLGETSDACGIPAVSRDGHRVVYASDKETPWAASDLYVVDLVAGTETRLTDEGAWCSMPAISPDGRWIAYESSSADGEALKLLDTQTATARPLFASPDFAPVWPAFSSDGSWIAAEYGSELLLVNASTGEVRHVAGDGSVSITARPCSPDGSRIVFARHADSADSLWIYDLSADASTAVPTEHDAISPLWRTASSLAFISASDDGSWALRERDLTTNVERDLLSGLLPDRERILSQDDGGGLFVLQGQTLVPFQMGRSGFMFPGRTLHAGANSFAARQVVSGSSKDSQPIELDASPSAFPDAKVSGIAAFSQYPLSGDGVLITGALTNAGQKPLVGCHVVLGRLNPDATFVAVLDQVVTLQPGETSTLRYTWDTAGVSGDFTWSLEADPFNLILESDETDNAARVTVYVRASAGVEVRTSTDSPAYFPEGTVRITDALLANGAPADYALTTRVEDEHGATVATADTRTFGAFGPGAASYDLAWPIPNIQPGNYRVHLQATAGGTLAAEGFSPFVLLPDIRLTAQVATDKTAYAPGATVNVAGKVTNGGSTLLQDLTALLKVLDAATGSAVAVQSRPVPSLPAGNSLRVTWAWPSSAVPDGIYRAAMEVRDALGVTQAAAQPYAFTISGGGTLNLTGSVSASPNPLEPSQALQVHATAHNAGSASLSAVQLNVSLVDPQSNAVLASSHVTADIAAGASTTFDHGFSVSSLSLRSYGVTLSASGSAAGQAFSRQLAATSFTVADLTPPQVALISPSPGLACDDVPVRVQATDSLTGVASVFYRLDDGTTEFPLAYEAPPSSQDTYSVTWTIPAGSEGEHRLTLYARDMAGNASSAIQVDLSADAAWPQVTLTGPGENSCVAPPTSVSFGATDLHLVSSSATLDGVSYVSAAPIYGDGNHTVVITATDSCGHVEHVTRQFRINSITCVGQTGNIPDGSVPGTQAMRAARSNDLGTFMHVTWDAYDCPSTGYHLVWGFGSSIPVFLPETPEFCNIGASGEYEWTRVPDPTPDPTRFMWFLVAGDDGGTVEGGWGYAYIDGVYIDRKMGAGTLNCGCTVLDPVACGVMPVQERTGATEP